MTVAVTIWLLVVLATLRPPFRRGRLGFAVYLVTMVVNEIPLLLLGVFVVSTAFAERPVGVPWSVVVAVMAVAVLAGLVRLQVRACTARSAFAAGLEEGLGRRGSRGAVPGRLPRTPWWPGILLPFQRRVRGVERIRDVSYGPDPAHRLDLYRATSGTAVRPVLIHLHGGGFVSGGRSRESVALLNRLAAHGWLCLSADYRLRAAGEHPNSLVDTKTVISWVRANCRDLGADPSQVFLSGCSAGGHLALSAALTPDVADLQEGFEGVGTSVAGVVVWYGYLGARTEEPSSSPALLARPNAPPVLIVHGVDDTAVPLDTVRTVAVTLRLVSREPVLLVELPHTQHSFDRFASVRARVAACGAEAFLDWARQS